jgi:hypothetical protein
MIDTARSIGQNIQGTLKPAIVPYARRARIQRVRQGRLTG